MRILDFKITENGLHTNIEYLASVDYCPKCLRSCDPLVVTHRHEFPAKILGKKLWIVYQCPSHICQQTFIAEFNFRLNPMGMNDSLYVLDSLFPFKFEEKLFTDEINKLSENFVKIYDQAYQAEQMKLDEICGPGYRKAFEFLIKDYVISIKPDHSEVIKEKFLGTVIKEYIKNDNVKHAAERAVWLGNDETHYIRKWENKDIQDMKILIELAVNFIHGELMMKKFIEEMTRGK